jgi:CRP-like cAMP-binding protein
MDKVTPEWLQSIEALQDVPPIQLQWLIDHSTQLELAEGDSLFQPGDRIKGMYIIIKGAFRLCMVQGNEMREVLTFEPKAITGYLPFSRAKNVFGVGEAMSPMEYLFFSY